MTDTKPQPLPIDTAPRDATRGEWMQTFGGAPFYPASPLALDVDIRDIAEALSKQCRYNGHCREFYSVAEHSVRVAAIVPEYDRLWALLHDASEAYIGDMIRPVKKEMPEFRAVEARVQGIICQAFGLPAAEPASVRRADNILLATEKRDLMNSSKLPWMDLPAPLPDRIIPWSWQGARDMFLHVFDQITAGPA